MNLFEDMQAFVRVVEAGSITQAAEQMNTVKSAVSQRLNRLESRLGIQLLSRTTRTQKLTEAGKSYYKDCTRILDDVIEAEAHVQQDNQALAGRINLAAPLSFGLTHLSQAIRQFNELHPDVVFNVDFNDRKVDLINDGFDLAIRIAHLTDSNLVARKLTYSQIVLCASPQYLAKHGMPEHPNDLLSGHHKLKYSSSPDVWQFKEGKKTLKINVPSIMNSNNGGFLYEAAIEGKGLIMSPDFICYKAIKTGQLVPLLCPYIDNNLINAYAVYPQNRHLPVRVKKLIGYLSEYFGDTPYWQVLH
ncbi:LysR family transcriptional regulator [Marinicella litoralis]|uniref:DNA-binding transcriptional LysR family regulator n=1 Tax=Marinicella litoralis TaxID=644220 RepID=A0A4R6XLD5_9GAMM|nr:LysR family transcriptional regulator [Marinicella litoralis]TDR16858.1 DNA-binding transcriptional LysR family regulator [Marinicella litoralis]